MFIITSETRGPTPPLVDPGYKRTVAVGVKFLPFVQEDPVYHTGVGQDPRGRHSGNEEDYCVRPPLRAGA